MKSKHQAIVASVVATVTTFVAWLATVPPEMQSGALAVLLEVFPFEWRPSVGAWAKLIATGSTLWATFKAAQSGPKSQPPTQQ